MQQSSMCLFRPYHVPYFPVYSKAIQYFLTFLSTLRGPPARKSSHYHYPFLFPCTVVVVVVVVVGVRLFRFQRSLRITFRESIFFFTGIAFCYKLTDSTQDTFIDLPTLSADIVPYEIITYVLDPPVFFGITYGAVGVPDLQYGLRRQLRTVRDNSLMQTGPSLKTA